MLVTCCSKSNGNHCLLLQGAFWGLMVGLVVGLIRFIWEFSYGPAPPCGDIDTRSPIITKVHYLHFGIILFIIVMAVTTIISLLTKPIDKKHVRSNQQCALTTLFIIRFIQVFSYTIDRQCVLLYHVEHKQILVSFYQLLPQILKLIKT